MCIFVWSSVINVCVCEWQSRIAWNVIPKANQSTKWSSCTASKLMQMPTEVNEAWSVQIGNKRKYNDKHTHIYYIHIYRTLCDDLETKLNWEWGSESRQQTSQPVDRQSNRHTSQRRMYTQTHTHEYSCSNFQSRVASNTYRPTDHNCLQC